MYVLSRNDCITQLLRHRTATCSLMIQYLYHFHYHFFLSLNHLFTFHNSNTPILPLHYSSLLFRSTPSTPHPPSPPHMHFLSSLWCTTRAMTLRLQVGCVQVSLTTTPGYSIPQLLATEVLTLVKTRNSKKQQQPDFLEHKKIANNSQDDDDFLTISVVVPCVQFIGIRPIICADQHHVRNEHSQK